MSLQVLTRTISPYNGPDLFLGLFSDSSQAQDARQAYIARVSRSDPWSSQSYRSVNLDSDVHLVDLSDHRTPGDDSIIVFMVTAYFDEYGQCTRRFLAVFSERQVASEFAKSQEALPSQVAPNRCEVDEVALNVAR
jgi:hypothetical protein